MCFAYSCKWRYQFATSKTIWLLFGRDTAPGVDIVLNGVNLEVVDGYTHVGVPLCSSAKAETDLVTQRIKACRRKYYAVEGVSGPSAKMTPLTLSKIYKAVCVPALTYGAEVWTPSDRSLQSMEKMHTEVGRRVQGLPSNCSTPASHSLLGWRTIEAMFDLTKLMWIIRLVSLPYTSIYHKLFIRTLTNQGL